MGFSLSILILIDLGFIAWQDFKYRAVYWFLFPLVTILFILLGILAHRLDMEWIIINISLLFFQFSVLAVWFYFRRGVWLTKSQDYIGFGDILFFIALAFLFSPVNFLLFQLFSMIIILMGYFIVTLRGFVTKQIPLAGLQALLLLPLFLYQLTNYEKELTLNDVLESLVYNYVFRT